MLIHFFMLSLHPVLISVNINRLTILDTVEQRVRTQELKIQKQSPAMSRKTSKYPTTKSPLP